jgi:phospholipase D1/2
MAELKGAPAPRRARLMALAAFVVFLAAAAAAWRWAPLAEWIDVQALAARVRAFATTPMAPLWVVLAYMLGSLVAVPVTLMIVVTALVFGGWQAFGIAVAGSLAAAVLTFFIGHGLGREFVERIAGDRLRALNRLLGRRGLPTIVALRVLPLAPFTVVNLAAGALNVRLRDFLLGTLLGMLPGILAITVFSDRVAALLQDPSPVAIGTLVAVVVVSVLGAMALRRWARRAEGPDAPP